MYSGHDHHEIILFYVDFSIFAALVLQYLSRLDILDSIFSPIDFSIFPALEHLNLAHSRNSPCPTARL